MGRALNHTCALGITLAVLLFAGLAVRSPAQALKSAAPPLKTESTANLDPFGRESPHSTAIGFMKYMARGDYATAAHYLQQPPGQHINLAQFSREMRVLRSRFTINVALLSDDPNGTVEAGLPPGQARAGVLQVGGKTTDVILVRVDDPTWGKIWLVSQGTVASLPALAAQVESEAPTTADRIQRVILTGPQLLGMSTAQWLVWLISIPISWLLAWVCALLLSVPRRAWYKLRRLPCRTVWDTPVGLPLRFMIAILLHSLLVYELQPPLLYRVYYFRFMEALMVGCLAWVASEVADQGFDRAVNRTRTQHGGGESILVLMRRFSRIAILLIALTGGLALLGLNVTTALTGLGIGGLAVALGAQKTLENLIGGVSLLMDKAVQIGDFCKIGDQIGAVEDIGLRSLKLRTLEQNLLIVPNGLLAQMQFENMKCRPKLLIHQNFSLRIETQVEQLRFVLDAVQRMMNEDSAIESGTSRLRVTNFAGAAFELELFAYGKTGNWAELTAIRQDVILKIAEIVKAAGTGFAAPTRLTYQSADAGVDAEKWTYIAHHATELPPGDAT
jgi:MscS family membrane protein